VTTEGSKTLLVVDIVAGKVTSAIETDQSGSHMVALAPTHDRAFVANIGSGSVSVIDLKTRQRVANIPSGAGTEGIAVSRDQREVWATNRGGDTVSIIDIASPKIAATLYPEVVPDPSEIHRRRQARARLERAVG
jgi:YVTN family beta-propeller protein